MRPTKETIHDVMRLPKHAAGRSRGARIVAAMRRAPKPKAGMTTAQLMALTRGD